jgi:hypothetical protein
MNAPATSRWQFYLLILSIAVAAAAGGLSWQLSWISKRREFLKIEGIHDCSEGGYLNAAGRPRAPALMGLLGEKGSRFLVVSDPADLARAKSLFPEADCQQAVFFGGVMVAR